MRKNINAIIVEDELKGLNNLKNMLERYCQQIEVIGEATTIDEGYNLLNANTKTLLERSGATVTLAQRPPPERGALAIVTWPLPFLHSADATKVL